MSGAVQNIFYRNSRDVNGQCPPAVAYTPQERQHTMVSAAKECVRILLRSQQGREALFSIAKECDDVRRQSVDNRPMDLANLVQTFIDDMGSEATFPAIIADDVYAASILGGLSKESGIRGGEFYLPGYEILVNRSRVEEMVRAYELESADWNMYAVQLMCTILNCGAVIFGEYLAFHMGNLAPLAGDSQVSSFRSIVSKAGEKLELGLFGSPISWFKDPNRGDTQPGRMFRADRDSEGRVMSWTSVNKEYIDNLADNVYEYPAVAFGQTIGNGEWLPLLLSVA